MPMDALTLKVLTQELNSELKNARINKVYQPESDELLLHLFGVKSCKLVISCNSSLNRLHLTTNNKDNPKEAPNFCMLLRKHITNGIITSLTQFPYERVVDICIEVKNELGFDSVRHLLIELTAKSANIIMTDERYIIIEVLKHTPLDLDGKRQLLNGVKYEFNAQVEKFSPFDYKKLTVALDKFDSTSLIGYLKNCLLGVSNQAVKELIGTDYSCKLTNELKQQIIERFKQYEIKLNSPSPMLVYDDNDKIIDFIPFDYTSISQKKVKFNSMSEVLDFYYYNKDKSQRFIEKSHTIATIIKNAISRTEKKIAIQQKTLEDAKDFALNKQLGDLLLSNLFKIKKNDAVVTVNNYYSEDNIEINISLDKSLSPQQNAQKYYKKYNKQKSAIEFTTKLLDENIANLEYLLSIKESLAYCDDASNIEEIKSELVLQKLIKAPYKKTKKSEPLSKPKHYKLDGYNIYVGKNNIQNDYVTFKLANSKDLWLHTKNYHSCHTIIVNDFDSEIPLHIINTAAEITAFFSSARMSSKIEVDFTEKKNVKKPSSSKLGFVNYTNFSTCVVDPKEWAELEVK